MVQKGQERLRIVQQFFVTVDFNGIVMFEPHLLCAFYGGHIDSGTNLFQRFTTTEEGDEVLQKGIVIPILGINDGNYRVLVRYSHEVSPVEKGIILENSSFPLNVERRLVLADLSVLREWEEETGWQQVDGPKGRYSVTVRGFRFVQEGIVSDCGYEFVLNLVDDLPKRTADLEKDMQVLTLP